MLCFWNLNKSFPDLWRFNSRGERPGLRPLLTAGAGGAVHHFWFLLKQKSQLAIAEGERFPRLWFLMVEFWLRFPSGTRLLIRQVSGSRDHGKHDY